jgi:N-acetylglucosamine-6-phosphate deacetylase
MKKLGSNRDSEARPLYRRDGTREQISVPAAKIADVRGSRFIEGLPVEFHCHGMGNVDFSAFDDFDLEEVERLAAAEQVWVIPTVYMPYSKFEGFLRLLRRFSERRADGLHRHLIGFAVEGPMLGSFGGTPEDGVWLPTYSEWERLFACGRFGLQYVVMSPDALLPESPLAAKRTKDHPDVEWVVASAIAHGVRPALGHFLRKNPEASAACVERCLEAAVKAGARPFRGDVVTDHLFNDMPLSFKHAWRTREQKVKRTHELPAVRLEEWTLENIDARCGVVPAAIMRGANAGVLTACINFDNEHVAIEVAKRAVEIIGAESIMAMTDRTDRPSLGSQALTRRDYNTLFYQAGGIVAAGSQPLDRQITNMREAGIDERTLWALVSLNASRILELPTRVDSDATLTCVNEAGHRVHYDGEQWGARDDVRKAGVG